MLQCYKVEKVCVSVCTGWRPRRTLIFASWDAEEFGLQGSTEWAEVLIQQLIHLCTHTHTHHTLTTLGPSQQDNAKVLQERAVAYINADSAIEGERDCVRCSVLLINYRQCCDWICFDIAHVWIYLNARHVHTEGWLHSVSKHFGVRPYQAGEQTYTCKRNGTSNWFKKIIFVFHVHSYAVFLSFSLLYLFLFLSVLCM